MRVTAASIKRQVSALYNLTATVKRTSRTDLGSGKWREIPATIATEEPCRIAPMSSNAIERALRRGFRVTHTGVFGPTLAFTPNDQVVDSLGRTFTVQETIRPSIPDTFQEVTMYQDQMAA